MTTQSFIFVMVGKHDNPVYEHSQMPAQKDDQHTLQFVLHSTLDIVEEMVWKNQSMNLKTIDRWGDKSISAFVLAGNMRLLLLHELKNEEAIKQFFSEVHELYIKILLNPFYKPNTPITSPIFDARVKTLAKKYLK